jgi:hypothetical protein
MTDAHAKNPFVKNPYLNFEDPTKAAIRALELTAMAAPAIGAQYSYDYRGVSEIVEQRQQIVNLRREVQDLNRQIAEFQKLFMKKPTAEDSEEGGSEEDKSSMVYRKMGNESGGGESEEDESEGSDA